MATLGLIRIVDYSVQLDMTYEFSFAIGSCLILLINIKTSD
jgi:hypothetical protein